MNSYLNMSTWQQGADAAREGKLLSDCPYKNGPNWSQEGAHHQGWVNGWTWADSQMVKGLLSYQEKMEFKPCALRMDDSSCQPVQALRCQTCGHWTERNCPAGGLWVEKTS